MFNSHLFSNRKSNLFNTESNNIPSGRSEVVVGVGKHKEQPSLRCGVAGPSNKLHNHNKITIDLNSLTNEAANHQGCNLEIYVLIKHLPGCKHKKHNEMHLGSSRLYDFVGKTMVPYRPNDDCSAESTRNHQCCQPNAANHFENRLGENVLSNSDNYKFNRLLQKGTMRQQQMKSRRYRQCPFYMIDEYSMVDTRYEDRPISKLYQQKKINFTQSEIDLYELDFIGNY